MEQACQHMQQVTATAAQASGAGWSTSQCVICVGELGIGNTTAAAALLAALSGAAPHEVCGRGTGEWQGQHTQQHNTVCGHQALHS